MGIKKDYAKAVNEEVENARGGQVNLKTRLDGVDTTLQNHSSTLAAIATWQSNTKSSTTNGNILVNGVETKVYDDTMLTNLVNGNIQTWFYAGLPTLANVPASTWTDDATKNNHLGDLYYDTNNNYAYRFALISGTYQWKLNNDTDITTALTNIGNLAGLLTTNKTNLVSAINEVGSSVAANAGFLPKINSITVVDDFAGKISGSVTENPNTMITDAGSSNTIYNTLLSHSVAKANMAEFQGLYDNIKMLDGSVATSSCSANTIISQQLYSFNLIRIIEDKFGTIPATTDTASKVAWLKTNITNIICNWCGYGTCPPGNKAYLKVYGLGTWDSNKTNSSNVPTGLSLTINTDVPYYIGSTNDGFIHFLAYTDASDGVTPSTIYTDYINIELTLKTPSGKKSIQFGNTRRDGGTGVVLLTDTTSQAVTSMF